MHKDVLLLTHEVTSMENQHRIIQGYRELTKAEIDLMNEIKSKGYELAELFGRVRMHVINQTDKDGADAARDRHSVAEPMRWLARAKTSAQDAIMQAVRAVAQPDDGF
jgi:hypothetical protein